MDPATGRIIYDAVRRAKSYSPDSVFELLPTDLRSGELRAFLDWVVEDRPNRRFDEQSLPVFYKFWRDQGRLPSVTATDLATEILSLGAN